MTTKSKQRNDADLLVVTSDGFGKRTKQGKENII